MSEARIKNVVVIAPHPDDETVACGGVIQKHIQDHDNVMVFYMTNGEKAYSLLYDIQLDPTPEELAFIRKEEAKAASRELGLAEDNLFFLGFGDWNLSDHYDELKDKVMSLFEKHTPDIVYVPYWLSTHPDHLTSNKVVRDVINELNIKPDVYNYIIHKRFERIFDYLLKE